MKALDTNLPSSSRRGPVRMDTQDGPWSVSVAETPYDTHSYSLYIKSKHPFLFLSTLSRIYRMAWHVHYTIVITKHDESTFFIFIFVLVRCSKG